MYFCGRFVLCLQNSYSLSTFFSLSLKIVIPQLIARLILCLVLLVKFLNKMLVSSFKILIASYLGSSFSKYLF